METGYIGIKFATQKLGTRVPNDPRLERLKYWCGIFDKNKLAPPYEGGSFGNLSFRVEREKNTLIITASQSGLGESTEDDCFVTVPKIDFEKGIVYAIGIRNPSSEVMVHYAIYCARPEIQAIFHGHCSQISRNANKMGIPTTLKEEPYGTVALVERVLEILGNNSFLEMKNHGFLSLGGSLDEAGNRALKFLKKCKPEKKNDQRQQ